MGRHPEQPAQQRSGKSDCRCQKPLEGHLHARVGCFKSGNVANVVVVRETGKFDVAQGVSNVGESTIRQTWLSGSKTTFDGSNFQNEAAACSPGQRRASPESSRRRAASPASW